MDSKLMRKALRKINNSLDNAIMMHLSVENSV